MLERIRNGQLLIVSHRRRNGLILCKPYHSEFAGPGAAVGGTLDQDCVAVLPVGNLLLSPPSGYEERQRAYLIRRQWIRLTQQFTQSKDPLERAQMILSQFENYFAASILRTLPDEVFAELVGVFPRTIAQVRRPGFSLSGPDQTQL